MSDEERTVVDIAAWVERARYDPAKYVERQATEILLTAIGLASPYGKRIFLKGGVLMGLVYNSPRQTVDIDFSTSLRPESNLAEEIRVQLDDTLKQAAAQLGYPDIICRVQTIIPKPRRNSFTTASFPALKVKVAYAHRDTPQEHRLHKGQCPDVIVADISFNEPVDAIHVVHLGESNTQIGVYSLTDLVAEKLRALLQQEVRNRYRRQDVYDIALLIKGFPLDDDEKTHLLHVFRTKCRARNIEPNAESISSPEVKRRALSEWDTLALEIDEVPSFDECFETVDAFYRGLPWS